MQQVEAVLPDDESVPKPDVSDWLLPVWRCWHRLHLDRPYYGGGLGPMVPGRIPWAAARQWAKHHDMSGDDFAFLDHCLRAMDTEYIAFAVERAKQPPPKARPKLIMP